MIKYTEKNMYFLLYECKIKGIIYTSILFIHYGGNMHGEDTSVFRIYAVHIIKSRRKLTICVLLLLDK